MDRVILHCDMNNFFASVELLEHPELADRPVAVSGSADNRHGIVLAKNMIAKKAGVVTAETVWQARKKCPDIVFLPPHHEKYRRFSRQINDIYCRYTDLVEPFSIDESWLDVTASRRLFGDGKTIADDIRSTVKRETGLTLSCGVSYNKVFAKMGSDYKKPDATTVITRDNFRDILWPLPVSELFFVGRASSDKLSKYGIRTIGDLAVSDPEWLVQMFGRQGTQMYEYANGLEDSPVTRYGESGRMIKSVGNGITFRRDLTGEEDIRTAATSLSDTVSGRLRKYRLKCRGVKVDIKDPGLKVITRQLQLTSATSSEDVIFDAVMELIHRHWDPEKPIRLLTVTGIGIVGEDEDTQLSLFDIVDGTAGKRENSIRLDGALDRIRSRYGDKSIQFGSVIGNDIGIDFVEHSEE